MPRTIPCLWFDGQAEAAANLYTSLFTNSKITGVVPYGPDTPGTDGTVMLVSFELDGLPFVAIDTAGVKRKAKIRDDLEFYSIHRAERSIRRADVTLLFIDPTQGISKLDKQLADYIAKQYKPCIFVVNKWDLIATDPEADMRGSMTKFANGVQFDDHRVIVDKDKGIQPQR